MTRAVVFLLVLLAGCSPALRYRPDSYSYVQEWPVKSWRDYLPICDRNSWFGGCRAR